jgi:hypothetical protein
VALQGELKDLQLTPNLELLRANHLHSLFSSAQFAIDLEGDDNLVVRLLTQMQHNCRNVEGLGGSSSCTLVGQFFGRLVEALSLRTKGDSRLKPTIGIEDPPSDWTLTQFASQHWLAVHIRARTDSSIHCATTVRGPQLE